MIQFTTAMESSKPAEEILSRIFDPGEWSSFTGWGMIPGVARVQVSNASPDRVGTVFSVENTDGSTHRETVVEYEPERRLVMEMEGFSEPLSRIAIRFVETWELAETPGGTRVQRTFVLYPATGLGAVVLRVIALFLRQAVKRHNRAVL